jgi:NADH dehydrogenase [ubiquinone] 1 alpha subcomplex assembly factor 6
MLRSYLNKLVQINQRLGCKKTRLVCYSEKARTGVEPKDGSKQVQEFNYCVELVKSNDFEAYLTTLIVPKEILQAAFVLKAFNIELLSIGRSAKEPRIAEIRLQFWKDQIDKIYAEPAKLDPKHELQDRLHHSTEPITNQVTSVVKKYNISKTWLNRLVDGRKFFLKSQFKTVDDLEKCGDLSNIYYILFNCMKLKNVDCDHAASHLAKAQLLCAVAKNLFKKPAQIVYYIPVDLLTKHKIAQQDLINFSERLLRPKQQNFKDLTFDLCSRANEHLRCARKLNDKIPADAKKVLMPSVGCDVFLRNAEKYDFDMMNPKMNSDFKTSFVYNLMLAKYKNKF